MIAIGVYQWLSNSSLYEHRRLENIKKVQEYADKCDDKHQYKDILYADIVSTPEGIVDNRPISIGTLGMLNKISARKLLNQFLALFDVKQKNDVRILGSSFKR